MPWLMVKIRVKTDRVRKGGAGGTVTRLCLLPEDTVHPVMLIELELGWRRVLVCRMPFGTSTLLHHPVSMVPVHLERTYDPWHTQFHS